MVRRAATIIASIVGGCLGAIAVLTLHLHHPAWINNEILTVGRNEYETPPCYLPPPDRRPKTSEEFLSTVEGLLEADKSNPRAEFELVTALSTLLPKIYNISRMKTPSPETFRNYVAPLGLPVIFTDMFDSSPLRQWNWGYVRSKWGRHVFSNTRQGNYSSKKSSSGKQIINRVSVKLADFIDVVTGERVPRESERGLYITKQKVIPPEELETEFSYPPFYPGPHKTCYLQPTAW